MQAVFDTEYEMKEFYNRIKDDPKYGSIFMGYSKELGMYTMYYNKEER